MSAPFAVQMRAAGIPQWEREYRFHRPRQWRFDWAWPDFRIALEFEGGTATSGRHSRVQGFENDCRKYNQAAIDGWLVVRVTAAMVRQGDALDDLRRAFSARGLE